MGSDSQKEYVDLMVTRLNGLTNPERMKRAATYFPTALLILGVPIPEERVVVKEVSKQIKKWPPTEVVKLALTLLETGIFECIHAGYELIDRHQEARSSLTYEDLLSLGSVLDNWALVDPFAIMLSGRAWREGRITDREVELWARSEDLWWRRVAVVSTVALNQKSHGGVGDPERTLMICEIVLKDKEVMVQKAVSWALRELSKREKEAVITFIDKHEMDLSALVRREVWRKITTGKKNG